MPQSSRPKTTHEQRIAQDARGAKHRKHLLPGLLALDRVLAGDQLGGGIRIILERLHVLDEPAELLSEVGHPGVALLDLRVAYSVVVRDERVAIEGRGVFGHCILQICVVLRSAVGLPRVARRQPMKQVGATGDALSFSRMVVAAVLQALREDSDLSVLVCMLQPGSFFRGPSAHYLSRPSQLPLGGIVAGTKLKA